MPNITRRLSTEFLFIFERIKFIFYGVQIIFYTFVILLARFFAHPNPQTIMPCRRHTHLED